MDNVPVASHRCPSIAGRNQGVFMARRIGLLLMVIALMGAAGQHPASAACPPTAEWPAFLEIAADARRVIIGSVVEAEDGMATRMRVEEILRGDSRRIYDLAMLQERLGPDPAACTFDARLPLDVGDRLAIALNGHLHDGQRGLDAVVLLDADDAHPNVAGLERLTTPQVRLLLGHESDGSTVAVPSRPKRPPDLFEALKRALFGDVFDWMDVPD
jgi:hypothetical protein